MFKYISVFILGLSLVLATGCSKETPSKSPTQNESSSVESDLIGTVKVENIGTETKVSYTFKNQSNTKVTVIGGAHYKLLLDHEIIEEGSVPVKDYIDLEPGGEFTDGKTFVHLLAGSYQVEVEWDKTIASADFIKD
ncbi:hypothetical protein [Paenibacillus sp. YAF4_2]|uniref:hypothetical protein n=1 Tax=Paenibacillus sp. YAF4_2 TaxID=3233085 RepID=UPI003F9E91A3